MGSTFAARRAGKNVATTATAARIKETTANISGSVGRTSNINSHRVYNGKQDYREREEDPERYSKNLMAESWKRP
jgi:hypothetical protein